MRMTMDLPSPTLSLLPSAPALRTRKTQRTGNVRTRKTHSGHMTQSVIDIDSQARKEQPTSAYKSQQRQDYIPGPLVACTSIIHTRAASRMHLSHIPLFMRAHFMYTGKAYPETTTFGRFSLSVDSRAPAAAPPYTYGSPSPPDAQLQTHRNQTRTHHVVPISYVNMSASCKAKCAQAKQNTAEAEHGKCMRRTRSNETCAHGPVPRQTR